MTLILVSAMLSTLVGNIAAFHPAYHSSALDYDHTAQLVTDGISCDGNPVFYEATLNGSPLDRRDYFCLFDYRHFTKFPVNSSELDLELNFRNISVTTDSLQMVFCSYGGSQRKIDIEVMVTCDSKTWKTVGKLGQFINLPRYNKNIGCVSLGGEYNICGVRLVSHSADVSGWEVSTLNFLLGGKSQDIFRMIPFSSCWISGGLENEWVYVDLGESRSFSGVELEWISRPCSGKVLVSEDRNSWKEIASFSDEDRIDVKGKGRYVKVLTDRARDGGHVILGEFKVLGKMKAPVKNTDWYLVRKDKADDPAFRVPVNLPSTVLSAYLDAGMLPDPSYADNNQQISDSYFKSDFIYRGRMKAPSDLSGRTYLNFDGVNWKADVRFNGTALTAIEGAFIRTKYDVTGLVRPGYNDVEVLVHPNDNPSGCKGNSIRQNAYNGGILGADNPTFHASIGWDWIPTVHGRNAGIWNDVYFTTSRELTIEDPFVYTKLNLPDTTRATVTISATLRNRSDRTISAVLRGTFGESGIGEEKISLKAGESREVSRTLEIENPRLWWPNGYGKQELYDVHLESFSDGTVSDIRNFKTGVRENSYALQNGRLTVWVNGRRFSGRGGNWGFSEFNLRFREKEYDTAVRLHKEQNFTMIRNWVGQVMDDEFYEACDKYGIMVWQDFWLANPLDGPDPYDEAMFMANADDLVRRIRNHPCIVVYVGRNEGVPPASLDASLRECIGRLHPQIYYCPDSSHGLLGGNGHYRRQTAEKFFSEWTENPTLWGQDRVHSEKGMPNVPNYESLVRFIPEKDLWPQGEMWAVHDWTLESAQRVGTFNDAVEQMFGKARNAREFCQWAQWVNYDGFRAIFESRSEQRRGLQLWMSHSAWPSLVWCTYDYYFDPTAAFFGCKKACEPLHIMWNPLKKMIEVVNISAGDRSGLVAEGEVLDMYGNVIDSRKTVIDSREDSTVPCFGMSVPERNVYYYRLTLSEAGNLVSRNFYVLGRETDNFKDLLSLPAANLECTQTLKDEGDVSRITVNLSCNGDAPAMMVRLMAVDSRTGERILPAYYSDNYFHLMPGEKRSVTVEIAGYSRLPEVKPSVVVSCFNNR